MSAVPVLVRPALRLPRDEVVLAVLLAVGALVAVGPRPALLGALWLAAVTPRLVATDIAERRLPDRLVLPGWPVALAAAVLGAASGGTAVAVAAGLAVAYGLVLLLLHVAGGMGLGDVKLAPVLGLTAAAVSPAAGLLAPLVAFLAGGSLAAVVLVRRGPGASVPFGPAMLLGAWAAMLLG